MLTTPLGRLRLSNDQAGFIAHLVRHHQRPRQLYQAHRLDRLTRWGITRFFGHGHPWVPEILLHARADQQGQRPTESASKRDFSRFTQQLLNRYQKDYVLRRAHRPLVTGHDLRNKLKLTPGPQYRTILRRIEEARLCGEIDSHGEALALAARLAGK